MLRERSLTPPLNRGQGHGAKSHLWDLKRLYILMSLCVQDDQSPKNDKIYNCVKLDQCSVLISCFEKSNGSKSSHN